MTDDDYDGAKEKIERLESEIERLRKLCAARPRPMRDSQGGQFTDSALSWFDKIDAAGRGEG
jgi:hypothetical protein